jgi:D-tyrosyl-tRNA(Tyr) deacylase
VFVGVGRDDTEADAATLAAKVVGLRVFEDRDGKMNLSLGEVGGGVLVVSQFTLLGDCRKGRRPSFVASAPPQQAEALYLSVADGVAATGVPVATGRFGAEMAVELVNDGPVTLLLDSRRRF